MTDAVDLAIHVTFVAVGFGLFAAADVSRGERVTGWWLVGLAVAAVVRIGLWVALEPPGRGLGISMFTELQQMAAAGAAVTAGVGAAALSASRSFRAMPTRWRRWRVGLAVLALAAIPIELAVDGSRSQVALWLTWSCLPVAIAFGRDGDARLDRGASIALTLVWIGGLAWFAGILLSELSTFLFTVSTGGLLVTPFYWKTDAPRLGWVLLWTTLAVARRPDVRAALVAAPALLVQLPLFLQLVRAPNTPPHLRDRIAAVVDLTGANVGKGLGRGIPAYCVTRVWGPCDFPQGPATLPLSPTTSLAEAPIGPWIVYQDIVPEMLGYRVVDLGGSSGLTSQIVRIHEQGGLAMVDGKEPALPLDASLMRALQERPRAESRRHLRIEIERTARWTVQDAVSICASAYSDEVREVECALVPPGAPPTPLPSAPAQP